jgi:nitrogen fixation protein FixH
VWTAKRKRGFKMLNEQESGCGLVSGWDVASIVVMFITMIIAIIVAIS